MPSINSIDGRLTPLMWPLESACEGPLPVTCEEGERPFEALLAEVFSLIAEDEERSTVIIREAIQEERKWQTILSQRLGDERALFSELQTRHGFAQKVSDVVPALCLAAGGILSMAASGGLALIPLSAVVLGGLLTLDTLLDNGAKKAVISWLGGRSDQEAWLQKIHFLSNVAVMGLGILINGSSETLIQGAAGFAASTAEASTRYPLDQQTARLIESDRARQTSKDRLDGLFGDAQTQMNAITSLYEMLTDLLESTAQTTHKIFR